MSFRELTILCLLAASIFCSPSALRAQGRILEIFPGTNIFGPAAQSLVAGDTLVVHQGVYNETTRMSLQNAGSAAASIVIQGATGESRPVITRPSNASLQNTINIEGSASYLTLKGLEIIGNGGDGVKLSGALSQITLEDLVIHDVDVAVSMQTNMNNIVVRRNHIYNTGIGGGTGEGMYIGCNNAACIVRNSTFEGNWIHTSLPGTTQGDGIEIKVGSHSNIVRDNVIHDRSYPGIFVYGTGNNPANIVEGNVIWNSLEGIYAVADAVVRNNIVFNSGSGLSLYSHVQVSQMKNVTAVNNTLYDNDDGVFMRWTSSATNMVFANNAIYSPTKTAVNVSGSVGAFAANYVGGPSDRTLDGVAFINGGAASNAFSDASHQDFWPKPGSPLLGTASGGYSPAIDFNGATRVSPHDVGAYDANGLTTNPGWRITAGFKNATSAPPGDTTAPTVSMSAPANGSTVSGTITVSANATDDVGVTAVQFQLDGANLGSPDASSPYSISWNTALVANGAHTLTAVARDAASNTATSAAITVNVNNAPPTDSEPPVVAITSPTAGATVSKNVTLTASATDNVRVVGVKFLVDGVLLKGEDLTAPYSASWNAAKVSPGPHVVTAVARDAAGNSATSPAVTVMVTKR